jgi:hypothetical protein
LYQSELRYDWQISDNEVDDLWQAFTDMKNIHGCFALEPALGGLDVD